MPQLRLWVIVSMDSFSKKLLRRMPPKPIKRRKTWENRGLIEEI